MSTFRGKKINNPYEPKKNSLYQPYKQYDEGDTSQSVTPVPMFWGQQAPQNPPAYLLPQEPMPSRLQQIRNANAPQFGNTPKPSLAQFLQDTDDEADLNDEDIIEEEEGYEEVVTAKATSNWDGLVLALISFLASFIGNVILLNRVFVSNPNTWVVYTIATTMVIVPAIVAFATPRMSRYIRIEGNTLKDIVLITIWVVGGFATLANIAGSFILIDSVRIIDMIDASLPWQVSLTLALALEVPMLRKLGKMGTK